MGGASSYIIINDVNNKKINIVIITWMNLFSAEMGEDKAALYEMKVHKMSLLCQIKFAFSCNRTQD